MTQPRLCIPVVPPEIRKALCLHIGISYTRFMLIGTILLCKRLFGDYVPLLTKNRFGACNFFFLNTLQIKHLSAYVPAEAGDRFLSMLPSWHAYERACEYFIFTCGVEQMYTSIRFLKVILILQFLFSQYLFLQSLYLYQVGLFPFNVMLPFVLIFYQWEENILNTHIIVP